jgi:hypothetical protein
LSGTDSSVIAPPFQHADADLVQQGAQQLLAVLVAGGGRRPHPGEVVTEGEDGPFLVRGQGFRARGRAAGQFLLGVGQLLQQGVPLGLQTPGDQPVVRVDGPVATLGLAGLVAGLLDLAAPLRECGVVTVLELLGGGQAGLQRGGLQRGQERGGHGGVDRDAAEAQVPGAAALDELAGVGRPALFG